MFIFISFKLFWGFVIFTSRVIFDACLGGGADAAQGLQACSQYAKRWRSSLVCVGPTLENETGFDALGTARFIPGRCCAFNLTCVWAKRV